MPQAEQMIARFAAYTKAIEDRDRDGLRACFTDDVVQVDPYPSPANVGVDAVLGFFDTTWSFTETMAFTVGRTIINGDRGVFPFTIRSTVGGATVEVDAVDVMAFAEDARIAEITAYVDMAGMRTIADPAAS